MSKTKTSGNFLLSTDNGKSSNDDGGARGATSTSVFPMNHTMNNLVRTGRTLGRLGSSLERHVERALSVAGHKAGFGPAATYEKIEELYRTNWKGDENKSKRPIYF